MDRTCSGRDLLMRPPRLRPGDRVRFVSPASTPEPADVERAAAVLRDLGLIVEIALHAFDEVGYLAGTDEHRLGDLNAACRDPTVRAVISTRGGKGAYRIADRLDFDAVRADPKPLVGFSEITVLHLALLAATGLAGIHGAPWNAEQFGEASAESFSRSVLTSAPVTVCSTSQVPTAALTTTGHARGRLVGGNLDMVATAAGWALPDLRGSILLLEDVDKGLGHLDRQLTMLTNGGHLDGIVGVAVGQFTDCWVHGAWTALDVLADRLGRLGVPILGGLPIGHGPDPVAVPIGTMAALDVASGTLTVDAAVS